MSLYPAWISPIEDYYRHGFKTVGFIPEGRRRACMEKWYLVSTCYLKNWTQIVPSFSFVWKVGVMMGHISLSKARTKSGVEYETQTALCLVRGR